MDKTLVVYDDTGKIYKKITGDFVAPVGLQHIITEIPANKILLAVDVSKDVHQAIFEDLPQNEMQLLQQSLFEATSLMAIQQETIDNLNKAISELAMIIAGGFE